MKENCAEVIGDGIGDDDGICGMTGSHKEVCVEICDLPLSDQDDDNFDEEAAADMETALMDAEHVMAETNERLAVALASYAQAKRDREARSASGSACVHILQGIRLGTKAYLTLSADATSMAYDMLDSGCNQDVVGNNCSSAGVALAVAKGVAQMVKDGFDLAELILSEASIDESFFCMEETSTDIAQLQEQAGQTEEKLDEIDRKVDALNARFDEILELLRTPPGRREGFPTKSRAGR